MILHCCGCNEFVEPRLTDGGEIYPHRKDLSKLPFWKCDKCQNFVGCHHKTDKPTTPLGCIPTKEIREARKHIHALIDPMWKSKLIKRGALYAKLSEAIGCTYHTAEIKSIEDARRVYSAGLEIRKEL